MGATVTPTQLGELQESDPFVCAQGVFVCAQSPARLELYANDSPPCDLTRGPAVFSCLHAIPSILWQRYMAV